MIPLMLGRAIIPLLFPVLMLFPISTILLLTFIGFGVLAAWALYKRELKRVFFPGLVLVLPSLAATIFMAFYPILNFYFDLLAFFPLSAIMLSIFAGLGAIVISPSYRQDFRRILKLIGFTFGAIILSTILWVFLYLIPPLLTLPFPRIFTFIAAGLIVVGLCWLSKKCGLFLRVFIGVMVLELALFLTINLVTGTILINGGTQKETLFTEVKEASPTEGETLLSSFAELQFGYGTSGNGLMDLKYSTENRTDWNLIGVMWERAHPGFANWQEIEPEVGQYNWEKIDEYVRGAQEKNIQILFTVWPFTEWDQETCNSHLKWHPNDGGKDPRDFLSLAHRKGKPCDMEAYKQFLKKLVERYDGDGVEDMSDLLYPVTHWEIGNEPDGPDGDFFQGSDEDYFEILKASYATIKQADSNAKVLIAAVATPGPEEPVRPDFSTLKLYELGAANYFDIMNCHSFGGSRGVREYLKKFGAGDRPIWFTEPGKIGDFRKRAETGGELAFIFTQIFKEESKYGDVMFFLGGGKDIEAALRKSVNIIAQELKDSSLCDEIADIEKGIECYIFFAEETGDRSLCEKISDAKQKDECYYQLSEQATSNDSVQTKTASDCEILTDSSEKDICYFDLSREIEDSSLCEEIADDGNKNKCYLEFARQTEGGSSDLCEKVADSSGQDKCYINAAIKSKNASLCDEIIGSDTRKVCFAVTTNDIGLCNEVTDAAIKDQCYQLCDEWNE